MEKLTLTIECSSPEELTKVLEQINGKGLIVQADKKAATSNKSETVEETDNNQDGGKGGEETEITRAMISALAQEKVDEDETRKPKVKKILSESGASSISSLKAEEFETVYNKLKKLK